MHSTTTNSQTANSHSAGKSAGSSPPHLLVADNFHPGTVRKLEQLYHTHKLWLADDEAGQLAMISDLSPYCTAVATSSWHCPEVVYRLPALKMIAGFGVGTDGIDLKLANDRQIAVSNTPDVLNDDVADLAVALILACHRNLINADAFVRQGQWLRQPFPFGTSLTGKTLGIIGLGRIGIEIAARARAMKMRVIYHNRKQRDLPASLGEMPYCASLTEVAEKSDVLLSMLPGGEQTRGLLGGEVFKALGPAGIFINVGRGSTVDEAALIAALQQNTIAAAGLDVYAREPRVPEALVALKNVVLLPHIGSATVETRRAMGQLVIDNLAAYFKGETLVTGL